MAYGGSGTKRPTSQGGLVPQSLAGLIGSIFEVLGILNKGSAKAQAAPDSSDVAKLQPISSNTLNVTRVGGITTLISAAGGAALLVFKVNKKTDPAPVVVAAYISVGVIVAAALITVALIIAADVRARTAVATAVAPPAKPTGVKHIAAAGTTSLDQAYDYVLVDAGTASVDLALPSATSVSWQRMTIKREDANATHNVIIRPQGQQTIAGQAERQLGPGNFIQIYSDGKAWLDI
jgi:hypothetical protein